MSSGRISDPSLLAWGERYIGYKVRPTKLIPMPLVRPRRSQAVYSWVYCLKRSVRTSPNASKGP